MTNATISREARDAIAGHLAGLGLPSASREGLLDAMEQGMAAGEADAFALRDRLVSQATAELVVGIRDLADEIADAVIDPAGIPEVRQ